MQTRARWIFFAAAAVPCVALLLFCAFGAHEWWLIRTHQIVVIPAPTHGATSMPEVPATRLLPLILGSGVLSAAFAWALLRRSTRVLIGAYVVLGAVLVAPLVARLL